MRRILPARTPWPLFGLAASRRIEAEALAAAVPQALMQRAGAAAARLALAVAPHAQRLWVVAGSGNNGGDGLEAALQWQRLGKSALVSLLGDPARLPADAAAALSRAHAAGVVIVRVDGGLPPPYLDGTDLAIDALLGLRGRRAPEGSMATLIGQLNALPCPVLSIDLPSGLDADSGQPFGAEAVRASHTLALLTLKPGLFTAAGRDHAGCVWFDGLGVALSEPLPDAWLAGPPIHARTTRRHARHKGSFGDVVVVGGAPGMGGALLLAARAAHAAGAGRVWMAALDSEVARVDGQRPELMWRPGLDGLGDIALAAATVVCGCGAGSAVVPLLPRLLRHAARLVLDADALNAIAADAVLEGLLRSRADRGQATVLTPHPLEAARLSGVTTAAVQSHRCDLAQALADRFACTLVLKGSGTVIAAPDEVPRINPTGNAALATAGTGDVLAGWLGGCWSADEGDTHPTPAALRAFQAACLAVWQHGAAADAAGLPVLRAGDLIEHLAQPLQPGQC